MYMQSILLVIEMSPHLFRIITHIVVAGLFVFYYIFLPSLELIKDIADSVVNMIRQGNVFALYNSCSIYAELFTAWFKTLCYNTLSIHPDRQPNGNTIRPI